LTPQAVIEIVRNAGGELAVCGDRISHRLPQDHPAKGLILDQLREHKAEIILLLSTRSAACGPSCYEIEPGCWVHHPWKGCTTPMGPAKTTPAIEQACWHCGGEGKGRCPCIACADPTKGISDECVVCRRARNAGLQ
jgi:hypothetical protein